MSPDRYGAPTDPKPVPACGRPDCRGWDGVDDELRPIPCYPCKPHLRQTRSEVMDYAETKPSARAQAAIEAAESEHR